MRWVCAGLVANRPNAPATVKRPQPPVLPATLVVNDLLTLPLKNGWRASWQTATQVLMPRRHSAVAEELLHRHADVPSDLAQERRCDIAPFVGGDRRAAALGITELLVGAALANHFKTQFSEDVCHLRWLENRS